MRPLPILGLLAGCAADETVPVELQHVSVLNVQTRGMALSGDGARGHAGMYGVTCDFTTRTALVGTDYDFQGEEDLVADGAELDDRGFTTVTLSPGQTHLTVLDSGFTVDAHVPNVVHGRLTHDFVAVVRDTQQGCGGGFYSPSAHEVDMVIDDLPSDACAEDASVAVNREDNALYIATSEGVVVVTPEGWTLIEVMADLVAWDPWSSALYAAEQGGSEVRAYELDGSLRWSITLPGNVWSLNHMGEHASAIVVQAKDGAGSLVVLDGETGAQRSDLSTPSAGASIVMSESGRTLGVQLPHETHFYRVTVLE
jgi:hypothetical protein